MVLIITTSKNPSRRSRSFIKDLVAVVPSFIKVERGKKTLDDLANIMYAYNSNGVVILYEKKGNPSALAYYVGISGKLQRTLLVRLCSVKLSREVRGFQRPVRVKYLFIDDESVYKVQPDLVNALATILDAKTCLDLSVGNRVEVDNVVKIVFNECGDNVCIGFRCVGSGRPCGPEFKVLKVVKYGV